MKKYVTFVKDAEESRKVQEALFRAGFVWGADTEGYVQRTSHHFISMNYACLGALSSGSSFREVVRRGRDLHWEAIDASDIISDPFQLDGAKQPEATVDIDGKEFSVSTIKAALKQYVE